MTRSGVASPYLVSLTFGFLLVAAVLARRRVGPVLDKVMGPMWIEDAELFQVLLVSGQNKLQNLK